jgi:hypothetical protein
MILFALETPARGTQTKEGARKSLKLARSTFRIMAELGDRRPCADRFLTSFLKKLSS